MYINVFKHRNRIYELSTEGKKIVDFQPTMFVNSSKKQNETPWQTIKGETVYPIKPGSMNDTDKFIDEYKNVAGFGLYGFQNYVSQYISEQYTDEELEYDIDALNIVSVDIETTTEYGFPDWRNPVEEVLLLTLVDFKTRKRTTFGIGKYTSDKTNYVECVSEKQLFKKFLSHWTSNYPHIITGWNNNFFDVPYVYYRMLQVLGEEETSTLSPWGICRPCAPRGPGKMFIKPDSDRNICVKLQGIANLDFMELFRKYGRGTYSSYKLQDIAMEVIGRAKLDHSEFELFKDFYNGNPIPDKNGNELQVLAYYRDNFNNDNHQWFDAYNSGLEYTKENIDVLIKQLSWNKFVDYNALDADLIFDLDDELSLLSLQVDLAYKAKINFEDVYSPVALWESIIFNHLKNDKIVMPLPKHQQKKEAFAGAFVKDPIVGKHEWVASFDLASLYPHLIKQYNISPETLTNVFLDYVNEDYILDGKTIDLDDNLIVSANGWCYDKNTIGVLPKLMDLYYSKRKTIRSHQLEQEVELEKVKHEMKIRGLL